MSDWLVAISSGIVSGVILSGSVYLYNVYSWRRIKRELLVSLDRDLNLLLLALRLFLRAEYPKQTMNNSEIINFYKQEILEKFSSFKGIIVSSDKKVLQEFSKNLNDASISLENLKTLYFSFRLIKPSFLETILDVQGKINNLSFVLTTFTPQEIIGENLVVSRLLKDFLSIHLKDLLEGALIEKEKLSKALKKIAKDHVKIYRLD